MKGEGWGVGGRVMLLLAEVPCHIPDTTCDNTCVSDYYLRQSTVGSYHWQTTCRHGVEYRSQHLYLQRG